MKTDLLIRLFPAWLCLSGFSSLNAAVLSARPKPQIIIGSQQAIDIFRLNSDGERVCNGSRPDARAALIQSGARVCIMAPNEFTTDQPEFACLGAEYHPDAGWLRDNKRDPVMEKAVEFTHVRIFEGETRRMPNFALHELAHACHNRTVRMSFGNLEIKAAYEKAEASGSYDRVERKYSEGRSRMDRAYAMTTPQEYFAESTEACFSRNDFFPFTRAELKDTSSPP